MFYIVLLFLIASSLPYIVFHKIQKTKKHKNQANKTKPTAGKMSVSTEASANSVSSAARAADTVKCKYCGSVFEVSGSSCPHCGASIGQHYKTEAVLERETQETLKKMEYQHLEKMRQYEAEKQILDHKKHDERVALVLLCLLVAFMILMSHYLK